MADGVFDVIVIGAGVEGSATAYQLMKLEGEKKIALVEQVLRTSLVSSSTINDLITRPSLLRSHAFLSLAHPLPLAYRTEPCTKYDIILTFFSLMPTTLVVAPMEVPG